MGDVAARVLAEVLTPEAWEPFGWLPVDDTDPADGRHRLRFEWDDAHLNVIAHAPDEVARLGGTIRCDAMYRHVTHTQALTVLNVDAVVAVAPAGTTFAGADDAAAVRAFLLHPLDALVLHAGTWHWGPFPLGDTPVRLLNLQGLRYAEDNERADLASLHACIDVIVAPGNERG